MKIYVAGKTHDYKIVRLLQAKARRGGHEITHDWTEAVEANGPDGCRELSTEEQREFAVADLQGVKDCDLLVAIGHERCVGTLWELGAASALGKPVWIVRTSKLPYSVFQHLPNIRHMGEQEAYYAIGRSISVSTGEYA